MAHGVSDALAYGLVGGVHTYPVLFGEMFYLDDWL